jgi:hypothetical protein
MIWSDIGLIDFAVSLIDTHAWNQMKPNLMAIDEKFVDIWRKKQTNGNKKEKRIENSFEEAAHDRMMNPIDAIINEWQRR